MVLFTKIYSEILIDRLYFINLNIVNTVKPVNIKNAASAIEITTINSKCVVSKIHRQLKVITITSKTISQSAKKTSATGYRQSAICERLAATIISFP